MDLSPLERSAMRIICAIEWNMVAEGNAIRDMQELLQKCDNIPHQ
jgi:hypothetical protein